MRLRLVGLLGFGGVLMMTGCPYTEGCETGSAPSENEGGAGDDDDVLVLEGDTKPNCEGLEAKCNDQSCCTASNIPGGEEFFRLNGIIEDPNAVDPDAGPGGAAEKLRATVKDFRLDVYEVTVARFRAFVKDGQGTKAKPPKEGSGKTNDPDDEGWDKKWNQFLEDDTRALSAALDCDPELYKAWTGKKGPNDSLPMNCATWPEAQAFCIWDGGRLPTEAEWNYAAAGGKEQRVYPFIGNEINEDKVGFGCQSGSSQPTVDEAGKEIRKCTFKDYKAVGTHKAGSGRWGQQDMAGSVWERVFDWYRDELPSPCDNCASVDEPSTDPGRVFRGGALNWGKKFQRTQHRSPDPDIIHSESMTQRTNSVGFRCARPVKD